MGYLIIIFLFISTNIFAQRICFREVLIDTFEIEISSSHYHFDKKGTYSGKCEHFLITFDINKNKYIVSDLKKSLNINQIINRKNFVVKHP